MVNQSTKMFFIQGVQINMGIHTTFFRITKHFFSVYIKYITADVTLFWPLKFVNTTLIFYKDFVFFMFKVMYYVCAMYTTYVTFLSVVLTGSEKFVSNVRPPWVNNCIQAAGIRSDFTIYGLVSLLKGIFCKNQKSLG